MDGAERNERAAAHGLFVEKESTLPHDLARFQPTLSVSAALRSGISTSAPCEASRAPRGPRGTKASERG